MFSFLPLGYNTQKYSLSVWAEKAIKKEGLKDEFSETDV
jgi:hypothetical protein